MMREPLSLLEKRVLVLGLGDTGLSVARWVERQGGSVRAADTRDAPPRAADYKGELHTGPFVAALLEGVDLVCASPGLTPDQPVVREARARGVPVLGDVELFARHARGKVIAVTGTNGKSTVTALTGHLLRAAGVDCEVAGNIGPPVLDALMRHSSEPAAWVLELSSYQLENTWSLEPHAAAMLNLSEDHLDRYRGLDEYGAAKARVFAGTGVQVLNRDDARSMAMACAGRARVFAGTGVQVLNRDDARSMAMACAGRPVVRFGLDAPSRDRDFGLVGGSLAEGARRFLPVAQLPIRGLHNAANALAASALARTLGVSLEQIAGGLRTFRGLPHRLQLVAQRGGVDWYDDSKGTNVGATIAALRGLGRKSVLILGGESKGQDFSPLVEPVRQFARQVLLIGRDAPLIEKAIPGERCASLETAVERAAKLARPGDAVLLSPACASFDMFRDYRHRGQVFAAAVRRLP